jgi:hypothetical protein
MRINVLNKPGMLTDEDRKQPLEHGCDHFTFKSCLDLSEPVQIIPYGTSGGEPPILQFILQAGSKIKGRSCYVEFNSYEELVDFYPWINGYVKKNQAFNNIDDIEQLKTALVTQNQNMFVDMQKLMYNLDEIESISVGQKIFDLLMRQRPMNNFIVIANVDITALVVASKKAVNHTYEL